MPLKLARYEIPGASQGSETESHSQQVLLWICGSLGSDSTGRKCISLLVTLATVLISHAESEASDHGALGMGMI